MPNAEETAFQYASRALTKTEQNYAQIEKEMLAISFDLDRFDKYVYGRHYSRRDRPFTSRHDSQEEFVEFAEAAATHVAEDTDVRLHSNLQERGRNIPGRHTESGIPPSG